MPFLRLAGLHRFPTLGEKRNFAFIMATCHPANTFQKHKVLVLTSVLASFSFNPPLDYWWKWHYFICASFSVPIPVYCYNVSVLLNYRCSVWHGWSPISLFLLYWETKLHSASSRMLSLFVILIFDNERSIVIHTHPFNGLLSGTTRVSQYQKGKTNLDFTEARDSEWQRHELGHIIMQHLACHVSVIRMTNRSSAPCSRQITTPAPHRSVFTGRMPFLPPNQQLQSTKALS